ncbi:peptidyl-tRNA hydrolase 2, mitochondrial-like [Lineus longissimus]|uniref:peptidyl-tRNA hydrolase 2, mitochondrial-like n=1 Tax=Lineus longissimus TaxID=88925 RepID=UPI002B4EB589
MDQKTVLSLAVGLGCGVCIGWILRGRLRSSSVAGAAKSAAEDLVVSMSEIPGEFKMVLVVRTDLKMGKGKVAAQCSHAAVNCCQKLLRSDAQVLRQWEYRGQAKVVLKTDTEASLLELAKHARALGLTAAVIQDAGRTQIAPGSKTVLGVGPGPASLVDQVTGQLKLF